MDPKKLLKFKLIRSKAGWHLRLMATNGKILLSSEVYRSPRAAKRVLAMLATIPVSHVVETVDLRARSSKSRPASVPSVMRVIAPIAD